MSNTLSSITPILADLFTSSLPSVSPKTSQSLAIPAPGKPDINLIKIVVNLNTK